MSFLADTCALCILNSGYVGDDFKTEKCGET